MRILPKFTTTTDRTAQVNKISDDLLRQEARIGGGLFGPVPSGHDRQFFCLDDHTWFWHEAWSDRSGKHSISTRYEIRPNGVFKVQNGGGYQSLSDDEAKNLLRAAKLYAEKILPGYQASINAA